MNTEVPLPPSESTYHSEWSSMNAANSSSSPPASPVYGFFPAEYVFQGFESPLTLICNQDYQYRPLQEPHGGKAHPVAPAPSSVDPDSTRDFTLTHRTREMAAPSLNNGLTIPHHPPTPSVDCSYPKGGVPHSAEITPGCPSDGQPPWDNRGLVCRSGAGGAPLAFSGDSAAQHRGPKAHKVQRRLTTKEEASFKCPVRGCGKSFSRSYNLNAHQKTHDENREYPFLCQRYNCSKKFVRKTDLQRHDQSVHVKERLHKCDYCGRTFARKDTRRRSASYLPLPGHSLSSDQTPSHIN